MEELAQELSAKGYSLYLLSNVGFARGALMYSIYNVFRRYPVFIALFILLSTAVIDEYIQSFTGRTSSVKDILIDFWERLLELYW